MLSMKFFNVNRIDHELVNEKLFINVLHLIETTIANPNLSVKFAQTCVASLRNAQLFDLTECRRHITEIYNHLVFVLQNINMKLADLADKWSSFALCHRQKSSLDFITIDRTVINSAKTMGPDDSDASARLVFFLYIKLLHELAHASIAELGRRLPSGDDDDRFSTPATHALTGEAGDAIERHFFGSVTDALGHYVDDANSVYVISHVILRERRNKQSITSAYLRQFLELNLAQVTSIPLPDTEEIPRSLSSKRQIRFNESPNAKRCRSHSRQSTKTTIKCPKQSPTKRSARERCYQTHTWIMEPDASEDDDDDDDTVVLDSTGKSQHKVIMWKE